MKKDNPPIKDPPLNNTPLSQPTDTKLLRILLVILAFYGLAMGQGCIRGVEDSLHSTPRITSVAPNGSTITHSPERVNLGTALTSSAQTPTSIPDILETPNDITLATQQSLILVEEVTNNERGGWILDYATGKKIRLSDNMVPLSWSPSGRNLLLIRRQELFLANAAGKNPQLLYKFDFEDQHPEIYGWWLDDNLILVQVWFDFPWDPHIYMLDITTGELQKTVPDNNKVVEAVSPTDAFWIQSTWPEVEFEVSDLTNKTEQIGAFQGIEGIWNSAYPPDNPNILFLPFGEGILFVGCDEDFSSSEKSCHVYRATILNQQIMDPESIYDLDIGEPSLRLSPDGQKLAIIQGSDSLIILNMDTFEYDSILSWEQSYSPPNYIWSPDSTTLVALKIDLSTKTSFIVKIDVQTREVQVIESQEGLLALRIKDWRMINITQ